MEKREKKEKHDSSTLVDLNTVPVLGPMDTKTPQVASIAHEENSLREEQEINASQDCLLYQGNQCFRQVVRQTGSN